jgi:sporadic carbohydrate cluster protein (TIGR04323 family)
MKLKGYCSVAIGVPVSVQNLVLRDYCARRGHTYLLADVEYIMQGSLVMLRGALEGIEGAYEGIVAYSMFLMPRERSMLEGARIFFALEGYELPRDAQMCELLWALK